MLLEFLGACFYRACQTFPKWQEGFSFHATGSITMFPAKLKKKILNRILKKIFFHVSLQNFFTESCDLNEKFDPKIFS